MHGNGNRDAIEEVKEGANLGKFYRTNAGGERRSSQLIDDSNNYHSVPSRKRTSNIDNKHIEIEFD
jgi:hypothetical protein